MRISDWSSDVCSSDLGADRRYGIDIDLIVEQHPAAAVDLRVDEAGQQPAALQVDLAVGGRIACIRYRGEGAIGDGNIRRLDGAAWQRDPAVVETKDHKEIGRQASRERGCQYGWISGVAEALTKK